MNTGILVSNSSSYTAVSLSTYGNQVAFNGHCCSTLHRASADPEDLHGIRGYVQGHTEHLWGVRARHPPVKHSNKQYISASCLEDVPSSLSQPLVSSRRPIHDHEARVKRKIFVLFACMGSTAHRPFFDYMDILCSLVFALILDSLSLFAMIIEQ